MKNMYRKVLVLLQDIIKPKIDDWHTDSVFPFS